LIWISRPSAQKRPAPAAPNAASVALSSRSEMPTSVRSPSVSSWRTQFSANWRAGRLVKVAISVPRCECAATLALVSAKRDDGIVRHLR
jgi:hypothetical protein